MTILQAGLTFISTCENQSSLTHQCSSKQVQPQWQGARLAYPAPCEMAPDMYDMQQLPLACI